MPTPYSIIAGYLVSDNVMTNCVGPQRNRKDSKGNLGPALIELSKIEDKDYMGKSLISNDSWIFYGFISWSPDGKKIMFDESERGNTNIRRCQIVKLKNYQPSEIKFADNFKIISKLMCLMRKVLKIILICIWNFLLILMFKEKKEV